ncbi:unnamed protein product [Phaedon cochleariae]|uniref:dual-specificity kinase n=1 Tax=Phaedon cochleariae TaxID=80249 RepID=A0A9N9X1U8_PHACE|nr:unnamed protein product [Phaedon cochleariae]
MIIEHSIMMYPSNKNESAAKSKISCQYDNPCNPKDSDYEKLFCPNNELSEPSRTRSDRLKTGSSCQALKHAVAALHRIDDFHKEKIGEGFFSEVFKVTDQSTGQVMVLKMNTRHSNRRNMLKEIELMNRLSHPNILRLKGVCVHQGQLHALTEHIDGGSLYQLIQDRAVEVAQETRVGVARDVARGMEYLHSKGVIHRDLTSKNILIKPLDNGRIRAIVADFGLSTDIPDPKEKERTKLPIVGSAYWMSPEMLKGKHYDERSDIFGYGIVLCELIARVEADPDYLPRTDNFGLDYLAFTELCEPNVVPEFLRLAFRCCNVDPKCRPTFAENVRTLSDILSDVKQQQPEAIGDKEKRMAGCAAKSEEQLTVLAHQSCAPQHQKTHHRRSLSEDTTMLCPALATPSDKARRHALLMCRQDPHYTPRTTNPFLSLHFRGHQKFLGNFSSCLEIPAPEAPTSLPGSGSNWSEEGLRRRGSCESGFYSSVGECLSPNSVWGSSLPSLEHAHAWCKRASSIYTDSSEDVSGSDWPDEMQPNISTIVEQDSGGSSTCSQVSVPRTKCSRLVVCEGAVRSKLPLFDKK